MASRYCKVCGTSYNYCPNCGNSRNEPRYRISFDKEECKKLFDVLSSNGVGRLSSEDTYKALKDIEYKKIVVSNEKIKEHIKKIEQDHKKKKEEQEQQEQLNTILEVEDVIVVEDTEPTDIVEDIKVGENVININNNIDVYNPDYPMGDKVLFS